MLLPVLEPLNSLLCAPEKENFVHQYFEQYRLPPQFLQVMDGLLGRGLRLSKSITLSKSSVLPLLLFNC